KPLDLIALFVNGAVVPATEHGEVGKDRRATVGPVTDVMPLAKPHTTPRETTTVITMQQRSSYRRRNRPGPGAHLGHPALAAVRHQNPGRVAGEPLRRSGRN